MNSSSRMHEDRDRQQVDQQAQQDVVAGDRGVDRAGDPARGLRLLDVGPDLIREFVRILGLDLVRGLAVEPFRCRQFELERLLLVLLDDLLDAGLVESLEDDRSINSLVARTTGEE
jgi:hypothetical protein